MYRNLEHNQPELLQHKYYNETLHGLDIDLKVSNSVHVFQNCEISNCYIRVNSKSDTTTNILSSNKWVNCVFESKAELSLSTIEADFYNCEFIGSWSGRIKGSIENCNFANANLVNFAFYNIESIGSNIFSSKNMVVEKAGNNLKSLKNALAGKSNLWFHIRPEMGLFVFNPEKHKNSNVIQEALKELSYVKFTNKA